MKALGLLLSLTLTCALANAEAPRQCQSTLDKILSINGATLGAQGEVILTATIEKNVAAATKEMEAFRRTLGEEPRDLQSQEAGDYLSKMFPYYRKISDLNSPFEIASIFMILSNDTADNASSVYDRTEDYDTTRLYMKDSRVVAVQFRPGEDRKTYNLDKQCNVINVNIGYDRKEATGIQEGVTARTCAQSSNFESRLKSLPNDTRDYENACAAVNGSQFHTPGGGQYCTCGQRFQNSTQPVSINPWAQTCGTDLPEHVVRDVIEQTNGFVWDGLRPMVQKIVDLCKENSSLLGVVRQ